MAKRKICGYELEIDDQSLSRYSANLDIYIDGAMAFAYPNVRLPVRAELALMEAIVRDLSGLIEAKKKTVSKLNARKESKS